MIGVCTPDFFQRVRGFGVESDLPVFIVGLPRSGTTLIEQILASHSQVFGAGEIPLARDTWAALGGQGTGSIEGLRRLDRGTAGRLASRHLERLRASSRTALRIVDKMPENYLYLGLLASLFPRAKLIHCRRDLRDVAVSCWITRFEEVRWANDQAAHRFTIARVSTADGALAEGLAGAAVGSGLRGDGGRSGRRGAKACGLVWTGVGAKLPGVPPGEAAGENGQRRPGAAAGLQDIGGQMEALPARAGSALRPAGKGGCSQRRGSAVLLNDVAAGRLCCHNLRRGDYFRSIGDCDPAPSSRSAASCRTDLSADSRASSRIMPTRLASSRRNCSPSGQA